MRAKRRLDRTDHRTGRVRSCRCGSWRGTSYICGMTPERKAGMWAGRVEPSCGWWVASAT